MNFLRASEGATDANNHAQFMAANYPDIRLVLGGFSQGAAVIDLMLGVAPTVSATPGVGAIPGLSAATPGVNLGVLATPGRV